MLVPQTYLFEHKAHFEVKSLCGAESKTYVNKSNNLKHPGQEM